MFDSVKAGLKDIFKMRYLFVSTCFFIIAFTMIIHILILTLDHSIINDISDGYYDSKIEIIYLKYEMNFKSKFLDKMLDFYENDAYSIRKSDSLSEATDADVYFIIGDLDKKGFTRLSEDDVIAYVSDTSLLNGDSITVLDKTYHFTMINSELFSKFAISFDPNDTVLLYYDPESFKDLIETTGKENAPTFIADFLLNSYISNNYEIKSQEMKSLLENETEGMTSRLITPISNQEDVDFGMEFLLPLVVLLTASFGCMMYLITRSSIQEMKRDLTIELQHGATIGHLFVRVFTYYFLTVFTSFSLSYFGNLIDSSWLGYSLCIYLGLLICSMSIIWLALYRENLHDNLRGDYS